MLYRPLCVNLYVPSYELTLIYKLISKLVMEIDSEDVVYKAVNKCCLSASSLAENHKIYDFLARHITCAITFIQDTQRTFIWRIIYDFVLLVWI